MSISADIKQLRMAHAALKNIAGKLNRLNSDIGRIVERGDAAQKKLFGASGEALKGLESDTRAVCAKVEGELVEAVASTKKPITVVSENPPEKPASVSVSKAPKKKTTAR